MFHTGFRSSVQLMLITKAFLFFLNLSCLWGCSVSLWVSSTPLCSFISPHRIPTFLPFLSIRTRNYSRPTRFPKFKRLQWRWGGGDQACWGYLPFVEYSVLIAYRFLISESFRLRRTHHFQCYCSLGFVNCHPAGRIISKLKALTVDSIGSQSPQQFHKTIGKD